MKTTYNGDVKVQAAYRFEGFQTKWTPPMPLIDFLKAADVPFDLKRGPNNEYLVTPRQSPIVIETDPFDLNVVVKGFAGVDGGDYVAIRWQDLVQSKWVYHLFEVGRESD